MGTIATVIVSIVVLGVAVALIGVRLLFVPGGEFRGTCATNNPYLRKKTGECWACGKTDDDECEYRDSGMKLGVLLRRGFRKSG